MKNSAFPAELILPEQSACDQFMFCWCKCHYIPRKLHPASIQPVFALEYSARNLLRMPLGHQVYSYWFCCPSYKVFTGCIFFFSFQEVPQAFIYGPNISNQNLKRKIERTPHTKGVVELAWDWHSQKQNYYINWSATLKIMNWNPNKSPLNKMPLSCQKLEKNQIKFNLRLAIRFHIRFRFSVSRIV